ncbi:MAG: hypothetical protein HDS02_01280 [Bacteroides sp.]|nr:hypothetical protein [Bacteroides sp.]
MKHFSRGAALIAGIMIFLLASCSGKENLLLSVPADNLEAVGLLRVDRMMEEAGCTRNPDGSWQPTRAITRLSERNVTPALVGSLLPMAGAADLSECAVWLTSENTPWILARVADSSRLEQTLSAQGFAATPDGDFTAYSSPSNPMKWFVKGKYLWGSTGSNASVRTLSAQIEKAEKAPASKIAGVAEFIYGDGIARIAITNPLPGEGWIRAAADTDGTQLTIAVSHTDSDGKVTAVKGLKKINRSFLDFVPHDFPFMAAIGVGSDFNWDAVAKAGGLIFGFQVYGTIEAIMPILKSVDGTVAMAFLPGSDDPFDTDGASMRFALFAEMKKDAARSALTKLRSYAGRFGLAVSQGPGDSFSVAFGESVYHASYSSGYFIISNFRAEPLTRHATMAEEGLASVSLRLSAATLGAVIGRNPTASPLQVAGSLSSEEANVSLRFTDSDKPFIETLTTILAD